MPLFGIFVPYLRGMILKELIQKYEFDAIVPDLISIDKPVQDNLYAFKEVVFQFVCPERTLQFKERTNLHFSSQSGN